MPRKKGHDHHEMREVDRLPPLAEMCKTARAERKLTQTKFAELVGTNQTEISFIERGFIPEDKKKIQNIIKLYEGNQRQGATDERE